MELALLCQRAENQYVGVRCGIMDQFAAACGQKDRLLLLDCRSLEYRTLPLPEGVDIIIADTTVRHAHASGAYNDRRAACEEAVRRLQGDLPGIESLRDVSLVDFNRLAPRLPPLIEKRARHVVEEIDRTLQAVELLEKGNLQGFGLAMLACHASQRQWLLSHHGVDEYLDSMKRHAALRGGEAGVAAAEAFVQHRGHAYPKDDIQTAMFPHKAATGGRG